MAPVAGLAILRQVSAHRIIASVRLRRRHVSRDNSSWRSG